MSAVNDDSRRKRIGWLCSYVPEELVIAAGLEPVRMIGREEEIKKADAYIPPNFCPYLKSILDSGLRDGFKDIGGIIFTNSCDGMRRLHDLWNNYVQTPPSYMLEVPKNRDDVAINYFSEQLLKLKTWLEKVYKVDISDDKLEDAISAMNDRRSAIMELFEKQKELHPPLEGSELLELCLEEMTRPKDETTVKLKTFAEKIKISVSSDSKISRIMIIGNVVDKPDLFNIVETAGASVVVFDTCTGLRHYSDPIENSHDPIKNLALRYLLKPPCPRTPGFDERIERIEQLTKDYSTDGIIYSNLKFCDYGLFDAPAIEKHLRNRSVPFLTIDNDYFRGDEGQIKTRIEAFVEMILEEKR